MNAQHPRRILFVDDDPSFRELAGLTLRHAGYEVNLCLDGADALAAMQRSEPELVLSDVSMPRMDGLELLRTVRRVPQWSTLPFVLVSALGEARDQRLGMSLGADDYVTKPFRAADLLRTIELRLERADQLRDAAHGPHFLARVLPHDLQPPLAGIIGCAEQLQRIAATGRGLAPADLGDFGRTLCQSGQRMLRLMEDFALWTNYELMLQRLNQGVDPGGGPEHLSGVELARLFRKCAHDCDRNPDLDVQVTGAQLAVPVPGVERVLLHLLENAFKNSPAGSKVRVTAQATGGTFTFQVVDHGCGMTPERIRRLGASRLEKAELFGPGLGLMLASRLALVGGGKLSLQPNITSPGLTVQLTLPLAPPDQGNHTQAAKAPTAPHGHP